VKQLKIDLPDEVAEELEVMVRAGWFASDDEAVRLALQEFIRRRRLEITEEFQREDIAWAVSQKAAGQ
jgi:Arc/MetJ-type ribon-helix-helix transcriptional regulator